MTEDQRQAFLTTLTSALKALPLGAELDVDKTLFRVSSELTTYVSGTVLDLNRLWALLVSSGKRVDPTQVAMVCLLLKRSEDRFGLTLKLPRAVEQMPDQQRLVLTATLPKIGLPPPSAPPPPPEPLAPDIADNLGSWPKKSPKPAAAGAPALKRWSLSERQRMIIGGVVILAAALALVASFSEPSKLTPIHPALPAELQGLKVYEYGDTYFFFDGRKNFKRPRAELDSMAAAALQLAQAGNHQQAWFCSNSDSSCSKDLKVIVRPGKVTYVDPSLAQ